MTVRDWIIAGVKTGSQVVVSLVIAAATSLNIGLDQDAVQSVVFALTTGGVAFLLNWAGSRYPLVARVLSFGMSASTADYQGLPKVNAAYTDPRRK